MRNVSDQSCRQNLNTHFTPNNFFFRKLWHLLDYVEKYTTGGQAVNDDITRCMRVEFWITEATNTPSQYITLTAFLPRQWLHERASILR